MDDEDWLWQSRKQVLFSYLHKAVLLAAAWAGFAALHWLGEQKSRFNDQVETQWRVTEAASAQVLAPCGEEERAAMPAGFATREEALLALQERAEACVWKRFESRVKYVKSQIAMLGRSNDLQEGDQKRLSRLHDYVEKEEAYARSKVAVARKQVVARLLNGDLYKKKPDPPKEEGLGKKIFPTLDEGNGNHVIYQILWYGALIFGLGASTLLGVLILTALPITDGEGYWTQRLGQIFDRIPGAANRTLAAPLLAATLSAGTLAGTVAETQPGGQSRTFVDQRTDVRFPAAVDRRSSVRARIHIDQSTGDTWLTTNYDGDIFFPPFPQKEPPWDEMTKPLADISERAGTIAGTTSTLSETATRMDGHLRSLDTQVADIMSAARTADERLARLERTAKELQSTSGHVLSCLHDLQPVIEKVENVKELVDWHSADSEFFAGGVNSRESQQENISRESLIQSAEVDTRNAFKRSFFPTIYQVNTAVLRIMRERLAGDPAQERFVKAVETMLGEEPRNSRKFKELLRVRLRAQDLGEEQIRDLINKHFLSLRRVSRLARS